MPTDLDTVVAEVRAAGAVFGHLHGGPAPAFTDCTLVLVIRPR